MIRLAWAHRAFNGRGWTSKQTDGKNVFLSVWSVASEKGDGKANIWKRKNLLCKQIFTLTWGGFWIRWKRVNVQVGRWKHICWINCGVENVELTVLTSYLCWCRPLRFLITRSNLAGSNNNRCADQWGDPNPKFVSALKEISLTLTLLSTSEVVWCWVDYFFCFLFATSYSCTFFLLTKVV